ncbi:MAG: SIR2 family protein [Verrucomicrobiaceae bacterium]
MKISDLLKSNNSIKSLSIGQLASAMNIQTDSEASFCMLLGAGASRSSGIKTGQEMVEEWRLKAYQELADDDTPRSAKYQIEWLGDNQKWYDAANEYASLVEHCYPNSKTRRRLFENEISKGIPSIGYSYLVRLAEKRFFSAVFTTNFDDLVNEAFYQFSAVRPIVCAHDSIIDDVSITSERSKIIKLHGDYLFNNIKNTDDELKSLEENIRKKLAQFLNEYGLVVSGYSGGDESVMDTLNKLIDSESGALPYGIYWCMRHSDWVGPKLMELLVKKKKDVFVVLVDGFDELQADLYSRLIGDSTPFNSKIASDRATKIITSYLENEQLKSSNNKVIKKHLSELEKEGNTSLINDVLMSLNEQSLASSGLSDSELLTFFEIEKILKSRDLQGASDRIEIELKNTDSRQFKELLLERKLSCSVTLHKKDCATDAIDKLMELTPQNYFIELRRVGLLDDRKERLKSLKKLVGKYPHSMAVKNAHVQELKGASFAGYGGDGTISKKQVIEELENLFAINPSIRNPVLLEIFNMLIKNKKYAKSGEKRLKEIVNLFLLQDPIGPQTMSVLSTYCEDLGVDKHDNKSLFVYLLNSFQDHFPRQESSYLPIIVDACCDWKKFALLRDVLIQCASNDELQRDEDYITTLMDVYYDVYRNLDEAIIIGEKFLESNKGKRVELKLFDLHLADKNFEKSGTLLKGLEGAISLNKQIEMSAEILGEQGNYQDAIDLINSVPDRRDFEERYLALISYYNLQMEKWDLVYHLCSKFLQKRSSSSDFTPIRINHELARKNRPKSAKVKKVNLTHLLTEKQGKMTKAVIYNLLDDTEKTKSSIREAVESKFSAGPLLLKWPAMKNMREYIEEVIAEFGGSKRSLDSLESKES